MKREQSFPYGASYSPLIFTQQEWDDDLSQMQAAHLNLVRIGDVHGSWDRIEPQEGHYAFDILQSFYTAAAQRQIRVIVSTGASSPPLWLARKYPDISILSSRGERYPLGASYHWACIHHPALQQASETYLRSLATFAIQQPNHFGWQISNEIGFPFMPAREKGELGLYCYCAYCQDEFREWLRAKYGDLAALTHSWSWSTTNFVYNGWEDISAPESMPASWSGVTRWIDWRLFWQDAFARFAGRQHRIIQEIDPSHPTSVNTFNFKGYDRFGTFMGLDQWKIAAQVDHIGYDLYPGSGDKLHTRPEHNSMFLDHGRSVARTTGRDFWIHEVESGPIGGWLLGPEHNTNAADISNYIIECLGHAAKLLLYMPWREWGYQPIRWGALVDLQGRPSPRLLCASSLGKFIEENSSFLLQAQVPPAKIAILESKPNAIFLRGVEQEENLFAAQRGAYRAFWEQGFSVDFITPGMLTENTNLPYRCICMPMMGLLDCEHAGFLAAYVEAGGILVGFARCATLNERGWYHPHLPIPGLGAIFGIEHIEADVLKHPQILFNGKSFKAWMNRDVIEPWQGTNVAACFQDGEPAVTVHEHGKGLGIYIATQADAGFLQPDGKILAEVIRTTDRLQETPNRTWLEGDIPRPGGIDPHILHTEHKIMVLFSNYLEKDTAAIFHIAFPSIKPTQIKEIFPAQVGLEWSFVQDDLSIELRFKNKEVKVIEIT